MPDPIHPRLLARVERSLRKRLNVDIGPHLQRFAAQAKSEDDFMAAAARLLVNPREREEWLASWAVRRLPGDDTGPMGLDSAPAPLDALPTGRAPSRRSAASASARPSSSASARPSPTRWGPSRRC